MSQRTQHPLTVVLFPLEGCNENFATLTEHHLSGFLNLETAAAVQILQQSATFLRLQCSDWRIKRHILGWETRSTAADQFHIRIKEELHKYERIQKASMWGVMQALYHANLRPSWSRSSVTWKYNDVRFFIHPGELPNNLLPSDIVRIAKRTCGIPLVETPHTHASTSTSIATQTDCISVPSDALVQNLNSALQQDISKACQTDLQPSLETAVVQSYLQMHTATATRDNAIQTDVPLTALVHNATVQTDTSLLDSVENAAVRAHREAIEHRARKQVLDFQADTTSMLDAIKQECKDRVNECKGRIDELIKLNEVLVIRCKTQQAELVALKQVTGK
jgi:hypothetical protein